MESRRWLKLPQGHKDEYYEELARIINLCQSISTKSDDPFLVDIPQKLLVLKQLLPKWKLIDDLLMDAEAIKELSLMVKLQSDWVKRRATGLFIDPFIIEVKIKVMPKESLASTLLSSWHPLVSAEQLTDKRLADAMDYWNILLPLSQRLRELEAAQDFDEKTLTVSELIKLRFLSDKSFNDEIKKLHSELLEISKDHPVDYWNFILKETYEETVLRAYALSFLISSGQADLIINPVEETTFVEANLVPEQKMTGGQSIAISVTYRRWKELKGVKNE